MNAENNSKYLYMRILLIGLVLTACAGSSYIQVRYQLPLASDQLAGKVVSLDFKDLRTRKNFLSDSAQKDFESFSGLFSLSLVKQNQEDELIGAFDIESLFKEAFRKRLAAMGIKVVPAGGGIPVMELDLRDFFLDYRSRKWITSVSFQARLLTDKGPTAAESVNITGERTKTFGKNNVEKHLSEIFSECLNKLNIAKLFRETGV